MRVVCPRCDSKQEVNAKIGDLVRCTDCKKPFEVQVLAPAPKALPQTTSPKAINTKVPQMPEGDKEDTKRFRVKHLLLSCFISLTVGYLAGREHIKYEMRNLLTQAFTKPQQNATHQISRTEKSEQTSQNATKAAAPAGWQYSISEDKMRNRSTDIGMLWSKNSIQQDFPYGEARLILGTASGTRAVMLRITSGQLPCYSNAGQECDVYMKFDDGRIVKYRAQKLQADDPATIAMVEGYNSIKRYLHATKKIIVEVEVYQKGRQQFEFINENFDASKIQ